MTSLSLDITDINLLNTFTKSCRRSIVEMVSNAQSGHPGGSLSSLDYLAFLYTQIIGKTGEKVVVSHGHISPAVYSVLGEMGYIDKEEVCTNFRKFGSHFEGHVTRHVPGICFGTGPLGVGVSAATGFAMANREENIYALMGDGEAQEGQVYEMALLAAKENLSNFILFIDYNQVQLTASLDEVLPTNLKKIFSACGWNVIECDGHDFRQIAQSLNTAHNEQNKPSVIIGKTIMGKGVNMMEETGANKSSAWHGKAPSKDDAQKILKTENILSLEETTLLENFRKEVSWKPKKPEFIVPLTHQNEVKRGTPRVYAADEFTDCRSAYGYALLDLAKENKNVVALSADLRGSVMTKFVASELPDQHIEVGIAEQNMVSVSGGLSLANKIPFCSTFGAFMSSRAKDQARVNDINQANVKMVATHCGLSVGEDGPTHQAIDDMGSFLGMFNTHVIEPADPNHCDRIIRYVGSHYGNFYVRMGRHKIPTLTHEDGSLLFDTDYEYTYGKCDRLRAGNQITIVATGATVCEALKARENFESPEKVEIIIISSIKQFDETLKASLQKNKKVISVEDHNPHSGLSSQLNTFFVQEKVIPETYVPLSVTKYELSGKSNELYANAQIDAAAILKTLQKIS